MPTPYRVQVCHETLMTLRESLAVFLTQRDRREDGPAARTNPVECSTHAALDADRLLGELVSLLTARPARPHADRRVLVL